MSDVLNDDAVQPERRVRVPLVQMPGLARPLQKSPGFAKKDLATWKLDLMGACEFQCSYCSTPATMWHRIHKVEMAEAARAQTGKLLVHGVDPVAVVWPDVIHNLRAQVKAHPSTWLAGETVVFSQLTDAFSPSLVRAGTTREALDILLTGTSARIRVLTKNSTVGLSSKWLDYFVKHRDRVVVGLSIGSLDPDWTRRVERGTPMPKARLAALHALQDAGVPTFGMMCPVFPDALTDNGEHFEALLDATRPDRCETVWAEPYNDRDNWSRVRAGYDPSSNAWGWMTEVYADGRRGMWSEYATTLYERLAVRARRDGWMPKLKYLLYEGWVNEGHAHRYGSLEGVLLQSPTVEGTKRSRNRGFARIQDSLGPDPKRDDPQQDLFAKRS